MRCATRVLLGSHMRSFKFFFTHTVQKLAAKNILSGGGNEVPGAPSASGHSTDCTSESIQTSRKRSSTHTTTPTRAFISSRRRECVRNRVSYTLHIVTTTIIIVIVIKCVLRRIVVDKSIYRGRVKAAALGAYLLRAPIRSNLARHRVSHNGAGLIF